MCVHTISVWLDPMNIRNCPFFFLLSIPQAQVQGWTHLSRVVLLWSFCRLTWSWLWFMSTVCLWFDSAGCSPAADWSQVWPPELDSLCGLLVGCLGEGRVISGLSFLIVCVCAHAQLCPTLHDPMDCNPPGSSVHGISQAGHRSGFPFPFPAGLPDTGWPCVSCVSCVGRRIPYHCTSWEVLLIWIWNKKSLCLIWLCKN